MLNIETTDKLQPLPRSSYHFIIYSCSTFSAYLSFPNFSTDELAATMAHKPVEQKNLSVHESDLTSKDSDAVPGDRSDNDSRFDQALDFLKQHKNDAAVDLSRQASFTRALRRRVDFRVIPFLCCCYTLNFLDKVLLNVRHSGGGRGNENYSSIY